MLDRRLGFTAMVCLAACSSSRGLEEPVGTIAGEGFEFQKQCPADDYQSLIGQQLAAVTYPQDVKTRIISPESVVTMDYRLDRMNIHTNEEGVITRVVCG